MVRVGRFSDFAPGAQGLLGEEELGQHSKLVGDFAPPA